MRLRMSIFFILATALIVSCDPPMKKPKVTSSDSVINEETQSKP